MKSFTQHHENTSLVLFLLFCLGVNSCSSPLSHLCCFFLLSRHKLKQSEGNVDGALSSITSIDPQKHSFTFGRHLFCSPSQAVQRRYVSLLQGTAESFCPHKGLLFQGKGVWKVWSVAEKPLLGAFFSPLQAFCSRQFCLTQQFDCSSRSYTSALWQHKCAVVDRSLLYELTLINSCHLKVGTEQCENRFWPSFAFCWRHLQGEQSGFRTFLLIPRKRKGDFAQYHQFCIWSLVKYPVPDFLISR